MTADQLDDIATRLAITTAPDLVTAVHHDDAHTVQQLLARLTRQELLALVVVLANNLADDPDDPDPDQPDTAAGHKQCRRCHQLKPLGEFYRDNRNTDALKSYCKPCDTRIVTECKKRARHG